MMYSANISTKIFQCPGCSEYLTTPIFQCSSGHTICCKCKETLPHCPTCRLSTALSTTRNFAMEQIVDGVRLKCPNEACPELIPINNFKNHEMACMFVPIQCKFHNCTWKNAKDQFVAHVRTSHSSHLINNNDVLKPHQMISTGLFLMYENYLFLVRKAFMEKNEFMSWWAELAYPQSINKNFMVTIRICTPDGNIHVLRQSCGTTDRNSAVVRDMSVFYMLRSFAKGMTCQISISNHTL